MTNSFDFSQFTTEPTAPEGSWTTVPRTGKPSLIVKFDIGGPSGGDVDGRDFLLWQRGGNQSDVDDGLLLPAVQDDGLLLPAVQTDNGLLLPY